MGIAGHELVEVRVEQDIFDKLTLFQTSMTPYTRDINWNYTLTVPIERIFKIYEVEDGIKYISDKLEVKTPKDTWVQVKALVKTKNVQCINVRLPKGENVTTTFNNVMQGHNGLAFIKDITHLFDNRIRNFVEIVNIVKSDSTNIYNLLIEKPYLYVLDNGLLQYGNFDKVEKTEE